MPELNKTYDPANVEDKWYAAWESRGYFLADEAASGPSYSVVIPPPNITGVLTMGHVLNNTLQDILVRFKRMDGFETLWMPGTDHAGIATQNVVEKQLAGEGLSRHDLGREEFERRVWAWKEKYGSIILRQLKKLGASCDWRRERFTMDPGLSRAVREVFVHLYEKKLIYRGQRIIHWCTRCHTALSDEEAITTEGGEPGSLWHIRYPAEDGGEGLVVATTRPETMLGDTGIAVNPNDKRFADLLGKRVILPLQRRPIPVVADEHVDPSFGTGAVKVTPAHDANDFEMGRRHGLESIVIMGTDGVINANGGAYTGLDRFEARKRVVADLEAEGLLVKTEPYRVPVRRCERCKTVIEPYQSEQWFVNMKPLAEPAIEAVRSGKLRLHPERWVGVYLHWMENIRDWCISRQLWWGHRIPVWYCDDCGNEMCLREDPSQCGACGGSRLRQDSDVLDTWFSSWLWPFSTMGWPEKTATLERFYPTNTLVTGADIIFFWVARMVMAGYEFMGECPFEDVYFNSIIRDLQGRKMSKSLGNSPDPLDVIAKYGADALRFTVISLAPPGEDVKYSPEKTDLGRHFANKIWNAARFVMMNLDDPAIPSLEALPHDIWGLQERWIVSRLQDTIADVRAAYDNFRFNDAALAIYKFVWSDYCDWYVERSKTALYGQDPARKRVAQVVLVNVLEQALRLLHPIMPFVTEEIWQALPVKKAKPSLMLSSYPTVVEAWRDGAAERRVQPLIGYQNAVRGMRSEFDVATSAQARLLWIPSADTDVDLAWKDLLSVSDVLRVEVERIAAADRPNATPSAVVEGLGEFCLPLGGLVDAAALRGRFERELGKVEKELSGIEAKLGRPDFVNKAPAEIVADVQQKAEAARARVHTLRQHLQVLSS